jgi:hypothetical protein
MTKGRRSGGIGARDLMEQLQNDPEYQRRVREADATFEASAQELDRAEKPIVADLRNVGVDVDSVWALVETSVPYPDALPVLLKHLMLGGYPDRVMEDLGRALAVKPAVFAWGELRELYLKAEGQGEKQGLAVALAASATSEQLDALIELAVESSHGSTRIFFLRPIKRLGGQRGREVLETLRSDPALGKEARALLKSGRTRSDQSR